MLKNSIRFLLTIVRIKPRLALAPKFKGNTFSAILVAIFFVRSVKLVITS